MMQEIVGFWDAVASAGPYANNLPLAPDSGAARGGSFPRMGGRPKIM